MADQQPGDEVGAPSAPGRSVPTPGGTLPALVAEASRSVARLAAVDGSAVTILSDTGSRELVYASNAISQLLDELQFTAGVGPCVDAFRTGRPVLCDDLASADALGRWFGFTDSALRTGVGGVYAFPLAGGDVVFGVLELYRTQPGSLTDKQFDAAVATAQRVATSVLAAFALSEVDDDENVAEISAGRDDILQSTLSRPQVNYAIGMISVQLGLDIPDSMARLRARAYLEQRSIFDVADDVVARLIRFDSVGDIDPGEQEP